MKHQQSGLDMKFRDKINKTIRRINTKYIFFTAGLMVFVYMLGSFGIANLMAYLSRVGLYFIPIILTWMFVYIFNAIAWSFIIDDNKISFRKLLVITISGYALNYITPFFRLGGEPYRVMALKEQLGINRAVSVTLSYVMLHFLSSFLIWIAAAFLIIFFIPLSPALYSFIAASLLIFSYAAFLFVKGYKKGVTKTFDSLLLKIPILRKLGGTIENKDFIIKKIDEGTKELYNFRRMDFYAANVFEFLSRVVATFEFYFILKAVGFNPTLLETFIINAGIGLIGNILFIVPFDLGVKEGGLYALLGFLQYTPSLGIFVAIVNRLRELFWIGIGLLLIMLTGGKQNKKFKTMRYDESDII